MSLNKPARILDLPGMGVKMSLQEIAREVRQGKLMILTLTRTWARDYWMYVLTFPKGEWPPYYDVAPGDGFIIIKFSDVKLPGFKTVRRRNTSPQITIPTRVIRQVDPDPKPGQVLAKWIDQKTLIVFI